MEKVDIKKWEYHVIFDDTENKYKKFSEIYSKDREAARYYILNTKLSSNRIVAFQDKNILVITDQAIMYGVSVTMKRYKSTKLNNKFWIDMSKGIISKYNSGKFIPCTPNAISNPIRDYIETKIPWMKFIFKLDLPVTFGTIVTRKLYSQRKLLTWFWSSNYPTALKLHSLLRNNGDIYILKTHSKNIRNINNINFNVFTGQNSTYVFTDALNLAVKTRSIINAAWSEKRLLREIQRMNRIMIDKLYIEYSEDLKINDVFLPILSRLGNLFVPKTTKDLALLTNRMSEIEQCVHYVNDNKKIIIKKDNIILVVGHRSEFDNSNNIAKADDYYVYTTYSATAVSSSLFSSRKEEDALMKDLNRYAITYRKMKERKNKITKIEINEEINEEKNIDIFF